MIDNLKNKKVVAQWKELETYIDKVRKEVREQTKKEILEKLPKITTHICRFNDGDCICRCYEGCINETKKIIKYL
jgi:hypothetical protein